MTSLLTEAPQQPALPEEGHNLLSALMLRIDALVTEITADRDERRARRKRAMQPVATTVTGSAVGQLQPVVPASGALVLDLGGPQLGREWRIVGLAVSDAGNTATACAGVADFYVGKAIPGAVPLQPTAWRWRFPNLPNLTTFSADARTVKPADHLYCVISSGTPTQGILAQAEVQDYDPVDMITAEVV